MTLEERRKNDGFIDLKLDAICIKIDNLASKNEEKFKTVIDYNKTQTRQIDKLNLLMTGNGSPEKGHATRMVMAEEKLDSVFDKFKKLNKFHIALGVIIVAGIIKMAFFGG